MVRPDGNKISGWVFYTFIGLWGFCYAFGMFFHWPMLSRRYAGVTGPLLFGLFAGMLTLCNLATGSIWRSNHPSLRREEAPPVYWGLICFTGLASLVLLGIGVWNWMRLT
jgi:hypothetical protein